MYFTLVRPILKFGQVIWELLQSTAVTELESVQQKFLRFTAFILKINFPVRNYSRVLLKLGKLFSAIGRKRCNNLLFPKKPLNNDVESSSLVKIKSIVSPLYHKLSIFNVFFCSANYDLRNIIHKDCYFYHNIIN